MVFLFRRVLSGTTLVNVSSLLDNPMLLQEAECQFRVLLSAAVLTRPSRGSETRVNVYWEAMLNGESEGCQLDLYTIVNTARPAPSLTKASACRPAGSTKGTVPESPVPTTFLCQLHTVGTAGATLRTCLPQFGHPFAYLSLPLVLPQFLSFRISCMGRASLPRNPSVDLQVQ